MKKKNVLLLLSTIASLAFTFGITACGNNNQVDNVDNVETYEYKIDRPAYWGKEGEVLQLNIFTDNPSPVIVWSSNNESVATVSATGEVTMKDVGQAKITATVDGKEYVCNLTVEGRFVEFYFDAEKVELSTIKDEFETSQTLSLTVDVNFETLENPEVIWTTGDPSIASVENGTVTAVGKGFTTVTASLVVGGKTYASSLDVSVYPKYEFVDKDATFISVSDLRNDSISFETGEIGAVEYVRLGDKILDDSEYEIKDNQLLVDTSAFSAKELGRQTLTMAVEKDQISSFYYQYPLVVATYVVRDAEGLSTMYEYMTHMAKNSDEYIVLASDIDYGGQTFKTKSSQPSNGALTWYGTFDGYGHTISNMIIGKWGLVCAVMEGTVKDLALVNVTGNNSGHGGLLVGTLNGTAENCFVFGTNKNSANAGLIARTMGVSSKVINCIVVDEVGLDGRSKVSNVSALAGYAGASTKNPTNTVENTLVVTNGIGVIDSTSKLDDCTAKWSGITKVAGNNLEALTGEMLKAFDGKGSWEYDETTKTLKLMGSVIHKVVKAKLLTAQFVEVNESGTVSLKFSEVAKTVEVEGVAVSFTQSDTGITFNYAAVGRRSARITTTGGDVYDIPFVLATYVVDSAAALLDMCNHMTDGTTGSKDEYIVLATNIDWKNENGTGSHNFTPTKTIATWSGIFDGYGHTISNITIYKAYGLICTTFYGKAMDLVIRNAGSSYNGTGGILCGSLGHASNKNETTYKNTVENVVIIGKNSNKTNAGLIARQVNTKAIVRNCIVVDTDNMNGTLENANRSAIGGVLNGQNPTIINTIAGTTGVAIINATTKEDITSSYGGVTKVDSEQAITAAHLSAFATAAGVNSSWTYNSTTGELSLMGNVVFKVSVSN